jgi:hypothetical protein
MNDDQTPTKLTTEDIAKGSNDAMERRRRLLKAGITAAPILMSLPSRSVYACLTAGTTTRPSGFCSMKVGVSSPGGSGKCSVSGKSPSAWCQEAQYWSYWNRTWPQDRYPKDFTWGGKDVKPTKCGQLFGWGLHADKTCLEVMQGKVGDEFHRWCVAAHLNADANLTSSVCTTTDVWNMWHDCNNKGYYEVSAGQRWTPADCVTYLKSTCPYS